MGIRRRMIRPWVGASLLASAVGACGPSDPPQTSGTTSATSTEGPTTSSGPDPTSTDSASETTAGADDSTSSSSTGSMLDPCDDPQPILQHDLDLPTGYELCADGRIRRVSSVACEVPTPTGGCEESSTGEDQCHTDDECVSGPHGYCALSATGFGDYCGCHYGCMSDADCGTDQVCLCGGDAPGYPSVSRCIPAGCLDSDACDGGMCRLGDLPFACASTYRTACTTADDTCEQHEDCATNRLEFCYPEPDLGHWACTERGCY